MIRLLQLYRTDTHVYVSLYCGIIMYMEMNQQVDETALVRLKWVYVAMG